MAGWFGKTKLQQNFLPWLLFGGVSSSIKSCPAGVPQGSVISPMLFNVHVNDLKNSILDHLSINTCKYGDNCTQDEVVAWGTTSHMQEVLNALQFWATDNMIKINPQRTKDMWICFSGVIPEPALLPIGDKVIERVSSHKTTRSMASGQP